MIPLIVAGIILIVAGCEAVDDEEPEGEAEPYEPSAKPTITAVCPDKFDGTQSCKSLSASKDGWIIARQVLIFGDTFPSDEWEDIIEIGNPKPVYKMNHSADTPFHNLKAFSNGDRAGMHYYSHHYSMDKEHYVHFIQQVFPNSSEQSFGEVGYQGMELSPDGHWAVGGLDENEEILRYYDLENGSTCDVPRDDMKVESVANDGTTLFEDLASSDHNDDLDFSKNLYLSNPCSDEKNCLAEELQWGCGDVDAISADGSTVISANACNSSAMFYNMEERPLSPPGWADYAWWKGGIFKDMSANGRLACFAVRGDYLLYDRDEDEWTSLNERTPLNFNKDFWMNMNCEVASEDGVRGALYFTDKLNGAYVVFRVDLEDLLGH